MNVLFNIKHWLTHVSNDELVTESIKSTERALFNAKHNREAAELDVQLCAARLKVLRKAQHDMVK